MASTLLKIGDPVREAKEDERRPPQALPRRLPRFPVQHFPHPELVSLLQAGVTTAPDAAQDTQIRRVDQADSEQQGAPQGRGGLCPQLGLLRRVGRPRGVGKSELTLPPAGPEWQLGGAGFPSRAGASPAKE